MEGRACFLRKAEQCRRLAAQMNRNDPTAQKLRALGEEYEAMADSCPASDGVVSETGEAEWPS